MNGDINKLAFILNDNENKYVVAIDEQYTINPEKQYFEQGNDFEFEIYSSINDTINIRDSKMQLEIGMLETYNEENEIIKNDERWFLLKDDAVRGKEVGYSICYCVDENSNLSVGEELKSDDIICFKTIYDVKESKAKKEYESIKSNIDIYMAEDNEGILVYKNFQGENVNLDNYQFARDIITKSLFGYDIYIRNSKGIKENVSESEVWYKVPDDENETQYEISICTQEKIDENREGAAFDLNYKFEHNDREYEVMTTELGGSLNFYTKIGENEFIYIFMKGKDIEYQSINDNLEIFVERIKEQLL